MSITLCASKAGLRRVASADATLKLGCLDRVFDRCVWWHVERGLKVITNVCRGSLHCWMPQSRLWVVEVPTKPSLSSRCPDSWQFEFLWTVKLEPWTYSGTGTCHIHLLHVTLPRDRRAAIEKQQMRAW
ncbi:unnamed protein product [Ixodes persulcatus]